MHRDLDANDGCDLLMSSAKLPKNSHLKWCGISIAAKNGECVRADVCRFFRTWENERVKMNQQMGLGTHTRTEQKRTALNKSA